MNESFGNYPVYKQGFDDGKEAGKKEVAGWISVNEKYPEHNQIVAFIVDKRVDWYGGSVCAGRFKWFDYGGSTGKQPEFTTWGLSTSASFWMPLPDSPLIAEGISKEGEAK